MRRRRIAASFIAAGIIFGAFGAHALRSVVTPELFAVYEKAVFYHLINSVGLFALSNADALPRRFGTAFNLLICGVVIFSGSLYLLALTGAGWLGAVTPLGGVCLIAGWLLIASV